MIYIIYGGLSSVGLSELEFELEWDSLSSLGIWTGIIWSLFTFWFWLAFSRLLTTCSLKEGEDIFNDLLISKDSRILFPEVFPLIIEKNY